MYCEATKKVETEPTGVERVTGSPVPNHHPVRSALPQNAIRRTVVALLEHLFFGIALFLIIPPIQSIPERKSFSSAVIPLIAAMTLSRLCALYLRQETWLGLMLKVALVCMAGAWNYARYFGN